MQGEVIQEAGGFPLFLVILVVTIAFIIAFIFGVYLGVKQKIVVFRNGFDVMVTGVLYLIPVVFFGIYFFLSSNMSGGEDKAFVVGLFVFVVGAFLQLLAFLFVFFRTWFDNKNPLKMLLALYIKIPVALVFFFHLHTIFTGKDRKSRRNSMFWSLIMLPLIKGLVRDQKAGSIPGERSIRKYRRS